MTANAVGALVTGADYRGLGLVRSLGRRGIPVCVLTHGDHSLARFSRFAARTLRWPEGTPQERAEALIRLAETEHLHGWVLLPTDDDTVAIVARNHDLLAPVFRLTTPPWKDLCRAVDKRRLYQLALDQRIDQPWAFLPNGEEDLLDLDCPFPVVIKPASRDQANPLTIDKAWPVHNRKSLLARYALARTYLHAHEVFIQEMIPGAGETQYSYAALCLDGRPLASAMARRWRQLPVDFGRASTYVETIDEPALNEPSIRLLGALGLTGLFEIEYKRDPRDGGFKLLDVNPRVWGWHTLCGRAGVDFPYLLWQMVHLRPVPGVRGQPGVRWVRMSTDLQAALREMARGRLSPIRYLRSLAGPKESAIFAYDDPLPGLLELPLLAYLAGKRLIQGRPV